MCARHKQFDIQAIQASWQAFDAKAHLRPIHNEKGYHRMVALMNSLLDVAGDDEDHPLSGLLDLVGEMVSKYEQEHYAIEQASPRACPLLNPLPQAGEEANESLREFYVNDALRFLMEARGLKQEDLSSIVPQSNLSAILAGKRKISATMAGKLGKFFGISPAVFVPV